ncbi:hypothetical protein FNU76_03830 [Chitinimonas arctica]|uniref:Uncharacterized protein n=1 Tax=Chitinimonas arctica TaxID=2594795 RepID=A0A516SBM6_9NEIS|nr:hypothetical protein [Chitinimonas arctica]QDQ25550.1 hypothetical protein FNU76_03830 [Chitinimonas arctica]
MMTIDWLALADIIEAAQQAICSAAVDFETDELNWLYDNVDEVRSALLTFNDEMAELDYPLRYMRATIDGMTNIFLVDQAHFRAHRPDAELLG